MQCCSLFAQNHIFGNGNPRDQRDLSPNPDIGPDASDSVLQPPELIEKIGRPRVNTHLQIAECIIPTALSDKIILVVEQTQPDDLAGFDRFELRQPDLGPVLEEVVTTSYVSLAESTQERLQAILSSINPRPTRICDSTDLLEVPPSTSRASMLALAVITSRTSSSKTSDAS